MPAVRAAVVAEMADVGGGVVVRRAAAQAVLRVGRVLERGARVARVVDPERHATAPGRGQIADLRVVGVHDEQRLGQLPRRPRASGRRRAPARRSGRAGRGRGCRADSAFGRRRCATSGSAASSTSNSPSSAPRAGRRVEATPRDEVGPGAVVGESYPRPEDLGGHRRRRRLAVRRRDEDRALRQLRGEAVDRPRVELPEQLAGQASSRRRARRGARASRPPGPRRPRARAGSHGRIALNLPRLASQLAFAHQVLYHCLYAPASRTARSPSIDPQGAGGVPGRHPPALHRRADPRRAARVGRTARPLADDEGVRGRSGGAGAPADGDRALRHLERGQARRGADAAPVRDPRGAASTSCAGSAPSSAARRPRDDIEERRGTMPSKSLYWHTFGSLIDGAARGGIRRRGGGGAARAGGRPGCGARALARAAAEVRRLAGGAPGRTRRC